ncbi:hypothetical protein [Lacticaseibacillus parakribbianus]|nr:hypothetical protein [Lacticaseibacillus parakribbianus]
MKKALLLTAVGLAAATAYTLYKLDWFHDDAKDYAKYESNRA